MYLLPWRAASRARCAAVDCFFGTVDSSLAVLPRTPPANRGPGSVQDHVLNTRVKAVEVQDVAGGCRVAEPVPNVFDAVSGRSDRGWSARPAATAACPGTGPRPPRCASFFWTAEAGLHHTDGGRDLVWRASLDDDMPPHLISAFATALASHEPVQRGRYDVPHAHLVTQKERGPQGEEFAAAHAARLKAVRAATRKARRNAAVTTRNGPVPAAAPAPVVRGR